MPTNELAVDAEVGTNASSLESVLYEHFDSTSSPAPNRSDGHARSLANEMLAARPIVELAVHPQANCFFDEDAFEGAEDPLMSENDSNSNDEL